MVGRVEVVGEVTPEGVGGFLTVFVREDAGLGLGALALALAEPDRVDVRRAAVVRADGLRFSSSDTEAWDLCVEAAVDGLLATVEPVAGRVGALAPATLVRIVELDAGFVAVDGVAPGRRGADVVEAGLFNAGLGPVGTAGAGFFTAGAVVLAAGASAEEASAAGASSGEASSGGASSAGASTGDDVSTSGASTGEEASSAASATGDSATGASAGGGD